VNEFSFLINYYNNSKYPHLTTSKCNKCHRWPLPFSCEGLTDNFMINPTIPSEGESIVKTSSIP